MGVRGWLKPTAQYPWIRWRDLPAILRGIFKRDAR